MEVSKVDDFEPTAVPTVGQLLRELDRPAGNAAVKGEDGQDEARKLEHGKSTLGCNLRLGFDFDIDSVSRLREDEPQAVYRSLREARYGGHAGQSRSQEGRPGQQSVTRLLNNESSCKVKSFIHHHYTSLEPKLHWWSFVMRAANAVRDDLDVF